MTVSHGGDPQGMREIGTRLLSSSHDLESIADHGGTHLSVLTEHWAGADLEDFSAAWPGVHHSLSAAAERCRVMSEALRRNADEQDEASSGAGGGVGSGMGSFLAAPTSPPSLAAPASPRSQPKGEPGDGDSGVSPEVAAQWATYDEAEKRAILQEMVNQQAKEYGIEPPPLLTFKDTGDYEGFYYPPNLWNKGRGRVELHEDLLNDPVLLNTVSHEMRHAMQEEAMDDARLSIWEKHVNEEEVEFDNGVTPEEVAAWEENDENYVTYEEDPDGYYEQPLEADAFAEGDRRASELTPEDLEQLAESSGG